MYLFSLNKGSRKGRLTDAHPLCLLILLSVHQEKAKQCQQNWVFLVHPVQEQRQSDQIPVFRVLPLCDCLVWGLALVCQLQMLESHRHRNLQRRKGK